MWIRSFRKAARTSPPRKSGLRFRNRQAKALVRAAGWSAPRDREGSTLLIVMVLLGMLSLVGFLFYTFAAQERSSATYFADSKKVYTAELNSDALFDFALEQLIVGPNSSFPQSALAGSRHSLLPSLFGRDIYPYNSVGVRLAGRDINPYPSPSNGSEGTIPFVDMDADGVPDSSNATTPFAQQLIEFNDSAVANFAASGASVRNLTGWPDPGVDYTYPDINNVWLSYKGYAIDANGNTIQVIIPSFHRPQLLRASATGQPSATWYQDSAFAGRILRPHPSHLNSDGNPRFPSMTSGTTLTSVFPFMPGTNGYQGVWSRVNRGDTTSYLYEWDVDNDGDTIKEGVWLDLNYPVQTTSSGQKYVPLFSITVMDADALFNLNAHGNAAYLSQLAYVSDLPNLQDLNTGVQRLLSGSNQGHGPSEINPQYGLNTDPSVSANYTGSLTQYQYEFGIAPGNAIQAANMDWYRLLTGTATFQSATQFTDTFAGRWGEQNTVLYSGLSQGVANGGASSMSVYQRPFAGITGADDNWNQFEGQYLWELTSGTPGYSLYTPNAFLYNASFSPKFFPATFAYYGSYPYGQPLDFNADGSIASPGSVGKTRYSTIYSRMKYAQYLNYDNPGGSSNYSAAGTSDETNLSGVDAAWHPNSLLGQQMWLRSSGGPMFTAAGQGPMYSTQVDEASEMIVDPLHLSSADSAFGVDEMASLQLSATDRSTLSLTARTRTLAPFNFNMSTRGDSIAQQFSTSSWDRKQYGYAGNGLNRTWEFTSMPDPGGSGANVQVFPPQFGNGTVTILPYSAQDPFRAPVRRMLQMMVGNTQPRGDLQFRLSLNHLTTTDGSPNMNAVNGVPQIILINGGSSWSFTSAEDFAGNVIQRPLTPHDPALTASQVSSLTTAVSTAAASSSPLPQEVRARLDRQQMARDIYVMLYTLGGGLDGTDPDPTANPPHNNSSGLQGTTILPPGIPQGYTGDNSAFNLYNDRQLREMAQFAVNVVDALDPDHVMTKFEYDKNLGDGWNLDDDAYTNDGFTAYANNYAKYHADFPEDSDGRGVVYGVEMQEMTCSEILAFKTEVRDSSNNIADNPNTEFNEIKDRYFTYIELRNIGLNNIAFSGQWRLRAVPADSSGVAGLQRYVTFLGGTVNSGTVFTVGNAGEIDGSSILNTHSRFRTYNSKYTTGTFNDPQASVVPHYPNTSLDLDLVENRDQLGTYKFRLTDPKFSSATVAVDTNVTDDVDITYTTGGQETPGAFFNGTTMVNATLPQNDRTTFILERRQYPDRPAPAFQAQINEYDNPWVPVDRISMPTAQGVIKFNPLNTTAASGLDTFLQNIVSQERDQPLVRPTAKNTSRGVRNYSPQFVLYDAANMKYYYATNSFMAENSAVTAAVTSFGNWQVLYDRPFASPVELFQIPLYGPQNVTKWTNESATVASIAKNSSMSPHEQIFEMNQEFSSFAGNASAQSAIPFAATAAGKILEPEAYENLFAAPGTKTPAYDNRWYRMFEFFEVPTRTHRQLGNPLAIVRQPGKLNPNTLRHPAVLAGLLDDTDVMTFTNQATARPTLYATEGADTYGYIDPSIIDPSTGLPIVVTGVLRDWWVQFLEARDGRRAYVTDTSGNPTEFDVNNNPIPRTLPDNVTGLYLPGLADSNPFRSFSSVGYQRNTGVIESPTTAIDQTLFRRLPSDMSLPQQQSGTTATITDKRHLWEVGAATEHADSTFDPVMRHRLLSKIFNNTTTRSHVLIVFMTVQLFEADDTTNGPTNPLIGGPLAGSPTYRGFFIIDRSQPEEAYDLATGTFRNFRALVKYRLPLN